MAEASIPVDLFNPGQVFACLGLLEAAEVLLGQAGGRFDWSDESNTRFHLRAQSDTNPVEVVLDFLAQAEPKAYVPPGFKKMVVKTDKNQKERLLESYYQEGGKNYLEEKRFPSFPASKVEWTTLPIRLSSANYPEVKLGHWVDGSSRDEFKLYAGNRSALDITLAMLRGKPNKAQKANDEPGGIVQLWEEGRETLLKSPFDVLTPMGGSFNFDPRAAWTAIGAGYSPNEHKKIKIKSSPVVELLAAWGLEHARPKKDQKQVRYAAWKEPLPLPLARVALAGVLVNCRARRFCFELGLSGKNKIVTFAHEERYS